MTPMTALYPSAMCEAIVGACERYEVDPVEKRWKKKPNTLYVSLDSENAKIPTRATSGSAVLDTYASEGVCIPAGGSGIVSTGISIEMPPGVYARIAPRSGLAVKNRIAVGGGVIDPDYDGEVKVILFNHGDEDFIVKPGDRIAQIVLERVMLINASIVPGKVRRRTDRGSAGFGSAGIAAAAILMERLLSSLCPRGRYPSRIGQRTQVPSLPCMLVSLDRSTRRSRLEMPRQRLLYRRSGTS